MATNSRSAKHNPSENCALGIFSLIPKFQPLSHGPKNAGLFQKFCMANGVEKTDREEAKNYLLERDHKAIHQLQCEPYFNGILGPIFLPPIFLSKVAHVIKPDEFKSRNKSAQELKQKGLKTFVQNDSGELDGDITERENFDGLNMYFQSAKDDCLVLHGHHFLMDDNIREKVLFFKS